MRDSYRWILTGCIAAALLLLIVMHQQKGLEKAAAPSSSKARDRATAHGILKRLSAEALAQYMYQQQSAKDGEEKKTFPMVMNETIHDSERALLRGWRTHSSCWAAEVPPVSRSSTTGLVSDPSAKCVRRPPLLSFEVDQTSATLSAFSGRMGVFFTRDYDMLIQFPLSDGSLVRVLAKVPTLTLQLQLQGAEAGTVASLTHKCTPAIPSFIATVAEGTGGFTGSVNCRCPVSAGEHPHRYILGIVMVSYSIPAGVFASLKGIVARFSFIQNTGNNDNNSSGTPLITKHVWRHEVEASSSVAAQQEGLFCASTRPPMQSTCVGMPDLTGMGSMSESISFAFRYPLGIRMEVRQDKSHEIELRKRTVSREIQAARTTSVFSFSQPKDVLMEEDVELLSLFPPDPLTKANTSETLKEKILTEYSLYRGAFLPAVFLMARRPRSKGNGRGDDEDYPILTRIVEELRQSVERTEGFLCTRVSGAAVPFNVDELRCHFVVLRALTVLANTPYMYAQKDTVVPRMVGELREIAVRAVVLLFTELTTDFAEGLYGTCPEFAAVVGADADCRTCRLPTEPTVEFEKVGASLCPQWGTLVDEMRSLHLSLLHGLGLLSETPLDCKKALGISFDTAKKEQDDDELGTPEDVLLRAKEQNIRAVVLPYANFMTERMTRSIIINGKRFVGFTETANALDGDDWMWTDDNAKTIEMLVLPGVYEEVSTVADKAIGFCLEMMRTDFILRRTATNPVDANMGGFKVENSDPHKFRFHNGLMNYKGSSRSIFQSYRFHDGRDYDAVAHTGVLLEFRIGGYEFTTSFEQLHGSEETFDFDMQQPDRIVAGLHGMVKHPQQESFLGRVDYSFIVNSSRTTTVQRFSFTPEPLVVVESLNVFFTTTMGVSHNGEVKFSKVCSARPMENRRGTSNNEGKKKNTVACTSEPPARLWDTEKPETNPAWWAALQVGNAGFSYGYYTVVHNSSSYSHVATEVRKDELKEVATAYVCHSVTADHSCVLLETKLLTAGGLYDDMTRYDPLLTKIANGEDQGMIDYSISYDIGAEVNALAAFYLFATTDSYSIKPSIDLDDVKSTIDRHLKVYQTIFGRRDERDLRYGNIFVRGLSFLLMSVNTMLAATGDVTYANYVGRLFAILMKARMPHDDAWLCMGNADWTAVDCHCGGLLAVARLAATYPSYMRTTPELRLLSLILRRNVVNQFSLGTQIRSAEFVHEQKESEWEIPQLTFGTEKKNLVWGFHCGLVLRSHTELEMAVKRDPANIHYQFTVGEQKLLSELSKQCRLYLERSTRQYNDGKLKEIKTALWSGETNTETQPWAVLGVHAPVTEKFLISFLRSMFRKHKNAMLRPPQRCHRPSADERVAAVQKAELYLLSVVQHEDRRTQRALSSLLSTGRSVRSSLSPGHSGAIAAALRPAWSALVVVSFLVLGLLLLFVVSRGWHTKHRRSNRRTGTIGPTTHRSSGKERAVGGKVRMNG